MPHYRKNSDGNYRRDIVVGHTEDGRQKRKVIKAKTVKELE